MQKSQGCMECHKGLENPSMHVSKNVVLGCTDCHGGNPTPGLTQAKAHVRPLHVAATKIPSAVAANLQKRVDLAVALVTRLFH